MLLRRLQTYLFGVLLGCVIVYFTLIKDKDRDLLGWIPANRVKTDILDKQILYSTRAQCELECLNLSDSVVSQIVETGALKIKERNPDALFYLYEFKLGQNTDTLAVYFERTKGELKCVRLTSLNSPCNDCE